MHSEFVDHIWKEHQKLCLWLFSLVIICCSRLVGSSSGLVIFVDFVCNESLIVGLMVMGQILLIPGISLCLRFTCWIFAWGLFFRTDLPLVEFLYSVYLIFFCSVSWGVTSVFNNSMPMFSANTGSNVPFVQWYRKLRFGGHFRWWGLMGM